MRDIARFDLALRKGVIVRPQHARRGVASAGGSERAAAAARLRLVRPGVQRRAGRLAVRCRRPRGLVSGGHPSGSRAHADPARQQQRPRPSARFGFRRSERLVVREIVPGCLCPLAPRLRILRSHLWEPGLRMVGCEEQHEESRESGCWRWDSSCRRRHRHQRNGELTEEEYNNDNFELSVEELKQRIDDGSVVRIKDGDEIEIDEIWIEDDDPSLEDE